MPMRSQTIRWEEDELAAELEPIEEGSQHILGPSDPASGMREMRSERDRRRWIIGGATAAVALLALVGIAGAWMLAAPQADRQESTEDLSQVALKYKKHAKKKQPSKKAEVCSKVFEQCGGTGYEKAGCCESGCICLSTNEFYSQCTPPGKAAQCDPALAKAKLDNWTKEAEVAEKLADNATGHLGWLEEQVNKLSGSSDWWTKKAAKSADEMGHVQWEMNAAGKKAAGNFSVEDGCSDALNKCSGEGGCCQKGCSCVDMGGWSQCHPASEGASCWASVRAEAKALYAQKVKEFDAAKAAADKDATELETRNKDLEKFRAEKELAEKDAEEKNAKSKKYSEKVQKWTEAFEGEAKAKEAAAAAAKAEAASAAKKKHSGEVTGKNKTAKKSKGHKEEEEEEEEEESEDEESADDEDEVDDGEEDKEEEDGKEEDDDDEKKGDQKDDEAETDAESNEKDGKSKKDKTDEEEDDWEDEEYGEEDE